MKGAPVLPPRQYRMSLHPKLLLPPGQPQRAPPGRLRRKTRHGQRHPRPSGLTALGKVRAKGRAREGASGPSNHCRCRFRCRCGGSPPPAAPLTRMQELLLGPRALRSRSGLRKPSVKTPTRGAPPLLRDRPQPGLRLGKEPRQATQAPARTRHRARSNERLCFFCWTFQAVVEWEQRFSGKAKGVPSRLIEPRHRWASRSHVEKPRET